ncbi:hypothetical protein P4H94_15150 [Paenibacillus macerans]|uniref:Nuclear transport factor 2 family protein n=1 Tax=Paenibacillus macerans TaxID=44252 RepID=A0A090ZAH9_PAEMA|nr:hypothetical protein [Paenibacillus macerans]KFN08289.1 hypothetical protein DJ90_1564 [Paenibacillus macerans]MCY7557156.1 hypothetical protein [Paenibacillus macerans]MEC0138196.1 hypothetical protein [Paenibacillus macerans]MEC0152451.1 hypothetical protein [Paenibacillus macerans]SUA83586.1 Uncharacterised protein [Paenibacillus macerans]
MTNEEARQKVQQVMEALFDPNVTAEEVGSYFNPRYVQDANGVVLDHKGFVDHARALKSTLKSGKVRIDKMFVDGQVMVSVHYVDAVKQDDSQLTMKVIACFEVDENGLFINTDELTHLVQGDAADRDLGSRT